MQLVSDTPRFKNLLRTLEETILNEITSDSSLKVYRGYLGPTPSKTPLSVEDKGYKGVLVQSSYFNSNMIILDLGKGRRVCCDVQGLVPRYTTFRRGGSLHAVIEFFPFLSNLYVIEEIKEAKESGERIIGKGLKPEEVKSAVLHILQDSFQYGESLSKAIEGAFGYRLDINHNTIFEYPSTIETPPIHIPLGKGKKWASSDGILEKLKIQASVIEDLISGKE